MKLCRQISILRKKKFATKGKKRRLKRVSTRRKPSFCSNPTPYHIPLDLQIDTLLRLPVKSLLRFQCVSKLWSSIITSQDFRNRQLNLAPSRLLITFRMVYGKELRLVSLPYPNVSSSSSSSCCVPYKDLSLLKLRGKHVYNVARGLICVGSILKVGICNPSTRRLHVLPRIKFTYGPPDEDLVAPPCNYFLGYDPVGDQYKVLAVDRSRGRLQHKILVLGGQSAWREAQCVACPHVSKTPGLYMDGTLYYGAIRTDMDDSSIIVSFDVRLETFSIINVPVRYDNIWHTYKTLFTYEGKLCVVENSCKGSFRMWVVEDVEKEEWSMYIYHLPQSVAGLDFTIIGTFYTGEICLFPKKFSDPVCLVYYNLKTNSTRDVIIEGLHRELHGPERKQPINYNVNVSVHFQSFMLSKT